MGVPRERLDAVLGWYERTLRQNGDLITSNPLFIPIAYSGPVWVKKWDSIEQAMQRATTKNGQKESQMYTGRSLVPKKIVKNPY